MEELVSKIQRKDKHAIAWIYNKYGKKLYGYAISKWHLDEDSSWEIVYKTLYKIMAVSDKYKFENENKFCAFLFKIFINYLRNHYRDNKKNILKLLNLRRGLKEQCLMLKQ